MTIRMEIFLVLVKKCSLKFSQALWRPYSAVHIFVRPFSRASFINKHAKSGVFLARLSLSGERALRCHIRFFNDYTFK